MSKIEAVSNTGYNALGFGIRIIVPKKLYADMAGSSDGIIRHTILSLLKLPRTHSDTGENLFAHIKKITAGVVDFYFYNPRAPAEEPIDKFFAKLFSSDKIKRDYIDKIARFIYSNHSKLHQILDSKNKSIINFAGNLTETTLKFANGQGVLKKCVPIYKEAIKIADKSARSGVKGAAGKGAGAKITGVNVRRKAAQTASEKAENYAVRAWRWLCKTGGKALKTGKKILFRRP